MRFEPSVRREFRHREPNTSPESLAVRIVGHVDVPDSCRNDLVTRISALIRDAPAAYSSLGREYEADVILDVAAEDVIACLAGRLETLSS